MTDVPGWPAPWSGPAEPAVPAGPDPHAAVGAVLEARAVVPVFQPIAVLDSGEVVGFEALARGPQDSPLHCPFPLFEAARAADRVTELDWLCRSAALEAALAADSRPGWRSSSTWRRARR